MILIISSIGLLLIIVKSSIRYRLQKTINNSNEFIVTVLAISFFLIFFIYVLVGQEATRYLTIMPLISVVGFIWILKTYYYNHKQLIYTSLVLLLMCLLFAIKPISSQYSTSVQSSKQLRASLINVSTILEQNHVKNAITGYWYGASLRFWSHNKINFTPIVNCNTPLTVNIRKDWFTSKIKSALVVNRIGNGTAFRGCTDSQLSLIYGQPVKKLLAIGSQPNTYVYIWIYNYNVRQKLLPFSSSPS